MSGIGGGGAVLIWLNDAQRAEYLDFYPMQPVERFRGRTGYDGGADLRIVGVPGNVAGLLAAHKRFGRLTREQVLAPAIRLAENGFPVGQILAGFIRSDSAKLARFPEGYRRMFPDGRALGVGAVLRNPELADALRQIARDGADAFYRGALTAGIVGVMNAGGHPVTAEDFAAYEPLWKRPLCIDYRGMQVLSAPPPQTGAQVLHTLQLLEAHDIAAAGLPTERTRVRHHTSALRVGMADNRSNDDPRWRTLPTMVASLPRSRGRAPHSSARAVRRTRSRPRPQQTSGQRHRSQVQALRAVQRRRQYRNARRVGRSGR